MEIFIIAGAIYLFINFIVTRAVTALERRLNPLHDNAIKDAPVVADVH